MRRQVYDGSGRSEDPESLARGRLGLAVVQRHERQIVGTAAGDEGRAGPSLTPYRTSPYDRGMSEEPSKRIDDLHKRFDDLRSDMDKRFGDLRADVDNRFNDLRSEMSA